MNRRGRYRDRRAFTLVETVVSLTASAVLLTAVASAMVLVSYAIPDSNSPARAPLEAAEVVNDIASELLTAVTVTSRGDTSLEFTVPNRDDDDPDETIRYGWSGGSGVPLTRRYNDAKVTALLPVVYEFSLSYDLDDAVVDSVPTYWLVAVRITLNTSPDPTTRVVTTAQLLNRPEVVGP